jgi:hypothetical protein
MKHSHSSLKHPDTTFWLISNIGSMLSQDWIGSYGRARQSYHVPGSRVFWSYCTILDTTGSILWPTCNIFCRRYFDIFPPEIYSELLVKTKSKLQNICNNFYTQKIVPWSDIQPFSTTSSILCSLLLSTLNLSLYIQPLRPSLLLFDFWTTNQSRKLSGRGKELAVMSDKYA